MELIESKQNRIVESSKLWAKSKPAWNRSLLASAPHQNPTAWSPFAGSQFLTECPPVCVRPRWSGRCWCTRSRAWPGSTDHSCSSSGSPFDRPRRSRRSPSHSPQTISGSSASRLFANSLSFRCRSSAAFLAQASHCHHWPFRWLLRSESSSPCIRWGSRRWRPRWSPLL